MSHSDPSPGPINRHAGWQSPAETGCGTPRDDTRPDKGEATGGPGPSFFARQHDICERLRTEVVWEPEVGQLLADAANEIDLLRAAIRRLAEQDATLSVVGGNVIVEMDGP